MSTPSKALKILVVDDDAGLLILMAEALRAEGYEVATAASGRRALDWLGRNTPDLMLLDLKLADVEGPALVERLRASDSPVPFVVVTGQGDEKVAVEVMKQGALDYVMKDAGLLDLLPAVVRRALSAVEQKRALDASRIERMRLEEKVLEIGERERKRIGQDLHDGLGQQLTAIELTCAGLHEDIARADPEVAVRFSMVGKMLREAIAQTRALARGLVPLGDDPDALRVGLMELAERMTSVGRVRCRMECPESVVVQDRNAAGHLYRIAQEAVNNAIKHSQAGEVVIRLLREGGKLELQVEDNGRGMGPRSGGGLGLEVMRHRAEVIGGSLEMISRKGYGVLIKVRMPIE